MDNSVSSVCFKQRILALAMASFAVVLCATMACVGNAFAESSDQGGFSLATGSIASGSMTAQSALTPIETDNLWAHDYTRWASPAKSFLHVNASGKLERVEYVGGKLVVEEIAADYRGITSQKVVPASTYQPSNLASDAEVLWGGFYSGSSNNYVVTGQSNLTENDSLVVYRITKYTKDWSYVACAELKGANTYIPFDSGGCDMVESGGKLYVRTCHVMYESYDGKHHQANVQIVVDESTMTIDRSHSDVVSIDNWAGYVSHSFAQHLAVLSSGVYGLDHGDAYPRGISIKQLDGSYGTIVTFTGNIGKNNTGASIGGFEASSTQGSLISAFNMADQDAYAAADYSDSAVARNLWVGVTKSDLSSTTRKLTSYESTSEVMAGTPFLVKVNENRFCVIWSELAPTDGWGSSDTHNGTIHYQFIDGTGASLGTTQTAQGTLSDCQPVVFGGKIVWYAGSGAPPSYYCIDVSSGAFYKIETLESAQIHIELDDGYSYYNNSTEQFEAKMPQGLATSCPETTVKLVGRELVVGTDYTLSYEIDHANAEGIITVMGKGLFAGESKVRRFPIMIRQLSGDDIRDFGTQTYTGKAIKPEVDLPFEGLLYLEGVDYTVAYSNNVNVGTAKVVVTGKGLCTGTIEKTFQITPASLSKADLKLSATSFKYTGKAIEPAVTVKLGSKTLRAGADYTVAYSGNVNAGKSAKVKITGKGSYADSITKSFIIAKAKNTLAAKAKANTVKWTKLKMKDQTIKKSKAFKVTKAKGKVIFKKANAAGGKKIAVSKSGTITVKKGLGKGTYKVKVKVTAKGNANFKAAAKTVTLQIKVK